jgi:release factor glutamine methyltransferase
MSVTIGKLLESSIDRLQQAGIADAEISARLILQNRLRKTPVQLQLAYDEPVDSELNRLIESDITHRANHYPLQYIIGEVEFYNVRLKVNESVLIPRPETEISVEQAIAAARNFAIPRILDIGSGSGNISIALAANIPAARIKAVDISEKAVNLGRDNAALNRVEDKIEFIAGDCLRQDFYQAIGKFDILVGNPPYIDESDFEHLQPEIKLHEPKIALAAEKDTLKYYRAISAGLPYVLNRGGFIIVEVGQGQQQAVSDIFMVANPKMRTWCVNDLNSIPRVVIGELID